MRYLIVSDIHGSWPRLQQVLSHFDEMKMDMLLILGDILNYGPRNGVPEGLNAPAIAEALNKLSDKIVAIRGNCDSEVDQMLLNFPIQATYSLLSDNGVRFFVTHGHVYNERNLPPTGSCEVFVYGHTHLQTLRAAGEALGTPVIVNTGSPTFPKGGNPPTFATYADGMLAVRTLDGTAVSSLKIK